MTSLRVCATYPFLNEAKHYVQKEGATVHELLTDPLFEQARIIALERIENVMSKRDVGNRVLSTDADKIMELFSYPLARMIAVSINDDYFLRSYALAEAVHMYQNLLKEPLPFILQVTKEFNLTILHSDEQEDPSLYFTQYLAHAPTRHKHWKMVNRSMANGFISLPKKDLVRILQEILRKRIHQELMARSPHREVLSVFTNEISRMQHAILIQRKKHEAEPIGKLDITLLPPCLKQILTLIQSGENVSHIGRFALVAFLNSLNLSTENILTLFSKAPDFDEERTRYQIEHILGKTGATSYKPPGCEKLKTYGLCPSEEIDDICRRVYHPTSYYRYKWKQQKKKTAK